MTKIYINGRFLTQKISGVQRFAIEITKSLKKINPNIFILSPKGVLDEELVGVLGVKIIGVNSGHLWEQIDLPIYLKLKGSPLLINLCNTGPLYYTNQIISIHDLSFYLHPEWFSKLISRFYNFVIPRVGRQARHVFTVSEFSKNEISHHLNISREKITVVHNAMSFNNASKKNDDFVDKKFLGKYLLSVGSLDPRKNLTCLLEAFNEANFLDVRLILIGDRKKVFAKSKKLDALLANSNNVYFTGYLNEHELVMAYKNACAFVYPSVYEGFGIPPLEAMSFDCPTCVSHISVFQEIFGDSVIYFNPYSKSDLIIALRDVIYNERLREKLIINGRERVKRYLWENSAKIISNKLNQLQ